MFVQVQSIDLPLVVEGLKRGLNWIDIDLPSTAVVKMPR